MINYRLSLYTFFSLLIYLTSEGVNAQENTLQALLMNVKNKQQQSMQINKERETAFLAEQSQQKKLLFKAEEAFRDVQAQNQPLLQETIKNDQTIQELNEELASEIEALGDIYSVLNSFTNEISKDLTQSMIHGQFPQRQQILTELNNKQTLPTLAQISQFWFTLLHQMIETSYIAQFPAKVIDQKGNTKEQEVTRIGTFTAFSEGKYLTWLPLSQEFLVLQRQPSTKLTQIAENFSLSSSTIQPIVIDPSQGKLLAMLTEKPLLNEHVQSGGIVGYIILTLGALGAMLIFYRFIYLWLIQKQIMRQLANIDSPQESNPLGRIMLTAISSQANHSQLEYELDEAILKEVTPLERGHGFLKVLTGVAPLLGLLGTITGMIETFQLMSLYGTGDAKLMSSGISQALVTTALGLIVAIPLLFGHNIITTRSKRIVHLLDEQCAGLMAKFFERLPQSKLNELENS